MEGKEKGRKEGPSDRKQTALMTHAHAWPLGEKWGSKYRIWEGMNWCYETTIIFVKIIVNVGAVEMAQRLGSRSALPEDLSSVPSTSQAPAAPVPGSLKALASVGTCLHTHKPTHIYTPFKIKEILKVDAIFLKSYTQLATPVI